MENLEPILSYKLLGSTVLQYCISFGLFLGLLLALKIVQIIIIARLFKITGKMHQIVDLIIQNIKEIAVPVLYFAAFYFSFRPLIQQPQLAVWFRNIWILVLSFQTTRIVISLVMHLMETYWLRRSAGSSTSFAAKSALGLLQFIIWSVAVIFILDNLGFNVSAVVAGLGIGGVAVALAAQTILGDLFNYFVIFFDRPFEEGDFVIFEDYMGVIENIGVKSTRIRSLGGEQIVISNSNLTAAKIRNYKRMAERRVPFTIGITYETPVAKVKKVPEMIRAILKTFPDVRIDRIHFKAFGSYSLDFEIVYYVASPDYNRYMDIQQSMNLQLMEAFQKEGIEFAYPTQVEYFKSVGGESKEETLNLKKD